MELQELQELQDLVFKTRFGREIVMKHRIMLGGSAKLGGGGDLIWLKPQKEVSDNTPARSSTDGERSMGTTDLINVAGA